MTTDDMGIGPDEYFGPEDDEKWDELEEELHAKADRRKKKKETMPIDGRGLVVNNVNRKYKRRSDDSIF